MCILLQIERDYEPEHSEVELPIASQNRFAEAYNILVECLSSGPVEYMAIMDRLYKNDVSKRTTERAKKELGIYNTRREGKTFWVWPCEDA